MTSLAFALRALGSIAALTLFASFAQAQTYPNKPIRLVLPYTPGGIIDTAGRNLAVRLSEELGQAVVPENRPGAGGAVGADVVARAAPDGYTIILTDPGLVTNPSLVSTTPYDLKKLQGISIIGSSPIVIVASKNFAPNTFAEFLTFAKANTGKVNYATAGIGTAPHLAGELIKLQTGIDIQHVPYRGIGSAYPDVMNGKVQLAFSSIAGAVPFTADNRVKALATTRIARSAVYPTVPTIAESGLPGFDVDLWTAVYAPQGTPAAILARLNEAMNKALQHPEMKAALAKIGVEPRGTTIDEASAFTEAEFQKWKKVIAEGKIKPE